MRTGVVDQGSTAAREVAARAAGAQAELGSGAMVTRARQQGLVARLGKRTGRPGGSGLGSLVRQGPRLRWRAGHGTAQGRGVWRECECKAFYLDFWICFKNS